MSVSRSWRSASFIARVRRLDVGAQVLGVLQRRFVARPSSTAASASASSSVCCGTSWRLFSSSARSYACLRLHQLGLRPSARRASARSRAGARCPARRTARARARARPSAGRRLYCCFSRSSSTSDLARLHAIAEVGADRLTLAFGFRRDRHFVDGGERADDLDGAVQRFLADRLDLDRLRGVAAARLRRVGFRAARQREAGARGRRRELAEECQHVSTHRDVWNRNSRLTEARGYQKSIRWPEDAAAALS